MLFTLSLMLSSCVQDLSFEDPQPYGEKNETEFKRKFRGTYLCLGDSSLLKIDSHRIVQEWYLVYKLPRKQLDTLKGTVLKENRLHLEGYEEPFFIEFIGDTAILTCDVKKTLFQLSENQQLKYYKGHYFLNFREPDNLWKIKTLSFDKEGILTIKRIYGGDEAIEKIKNMTAVEEIKNDEGELLNYKLRPTKKELKELMKSNLFKEGERFKKIKKT